MKKLLLSLAILILGHLTNIYAQQKVSILTKNRTILGNSLNNSNNSYNIENDQTVFRSENSINSTLPLFKADKDKGGCLDTAPTRVWDNVISQSSTEYIQPITEYVRAVVSASDGGSLSVIERIWPWSNVKVVKCDKNGIIVWSRYFPNELYSPSIKTAVQTTDGGFLLGGYTATDITYPDANFLTKKDSYGNKTTDFWIFKIDANGNTLWSKNFGGNKEDLLEKIEKTSDGGYLLGGTTNSVLSFDVSESGSSINNYMDYWIVKIDQNGNKLWDKRWHYNQDGTNDYFLALGTIKEVDNDIVISGAVWRISIEGGFGYQYQHHILKLNSSRVKQWETVFGFGKQDIYTGTMDMIVMSDKSLMLAGTSLPNKNKTPSDLNNLYLVKINKNGHKQWEKEFNVGNAYSQRLIKNVRNEDNFIVVAASNAGISKDKTEASKGDADLWINKFDKNGSQIWDKTIGGSSYEFVGSMDINTDNEIILGGYSASPMSGDKSVAKDGTWLVKLASSCPESSSVTTNTNKLNQARIDSNISTFYNDENSMITLQIYPNPAQQEVIIRMDGLNKETAVQILDFSGRMQYHAEYQRDMKISLANFQAGIYFIRCENIVQKLIVR
jgi:Secretion system C-terminal sorting domain